MEFPCDVRYIYIMYIRNIYNIKIMLHKNVLCKYFNYAYYNCIIIHNIYHFHIFYVKHNYVYIIIIYSI